MKIRWTPEARQDRADIWDYLFGRDENAAARIDGLISEAVAQLADFPMFGHEGEVAGTRELTPHSSYPIGLRDIRRHRLGSGRHPYQAPMAADALGSVIGASGNPSVFLDRGGGRRMERLADVA